MTVALAGAVIAYVVQQQFLFPLSELDPLFWAAAGMLVAATATPTPTPTRAPARMYPERCPRSSRSCVLFGAFMGAREVVADRLLLQAADAPGAIGLRDADHATRLRPDSIRTWYVAREHRHARTGDHRCRRGGRPRRARAPAIAARPRAAGLDADLLVRRALRSGLDDDRARARRRRRS